ncbi:MAG: hypothetical protein IH786_11650, partial [Proteobacteria bacterium]|nr:hypothetical protein [Pseudomonadota bacterium]
MNATGIEAAGQPGPPQGLVSLGRFTENAVTGLALLAMSLLPVLELLLRTTLARGIPGSVEYVPHLTLRVGFLGAV